MPRRPSSHSAPARRDAAHAVFSDALLTAVTKRDGSWWIGWIEEVPGVNCQERTRRKLIESLRVTLKEAIEFNRQDTAGLASRATHRS